MRRGLIRVARLSRSIHNSRLDRLVTPLRQPHEPNAVRSQYLPLVEELRKNPTSEPVLTKAQLMTIVDMLATSGRPADLECIRLMCSHLPTYFGVPVTPELHIVVISSLLRQGYVPLAHDWIQQIPHLPPQDPPTLEHYHAFLRSCPTHVQPSMLTDVVAHRMRKAGVRPTNETFSILIRCLIHNAQATKHSLQPEFFHSLITDMKLTRISFDPSIISAITNYFTEQGFPDNAEELRATYNSHFPPVALTQEEEQVAALKKRLSVMPGFNRALRTFTRLVYKGLAGQPTPEILRAILSSSRNIQDLHRVEGTLGVKADASVYALLVNNNIRSKQLDAALQLYAEAKKAGIIPVAGLVAPMIRSLCSTERKATKLHNAHLDKALSLYADIDEAFPAAPEDLPQSRAAQDHSLHSNGPDIGIYTSLMRGIAMSSNIKTAVPVAQSLLADMESRNIPQTAAIKTSSLILEMRSCETLDEAFNVYRKTRAELSDNGYSTILRAFSRMSHSMGHPDMLQYYFQIVQDMRQAGFRATERVYTDILQQLSEVGGLRKKRWSAAHDHDPLATPPAKMNTDLEAAVRQVHNIIALDTTIQPDRHLWNQLMDTYQRLGNFAEAFRVWETMYHAQKYGSISVSIVLDACGYAGEFDVARQIINNIRSQGYVLTLHNWNTYIEALCRLRQFSKALEVITLDMGTTAQPVKPEISTILVMVKLAQTRIQTNIILQRVRRFLPDLWTEWEEQKKQRSPPNESEENEENERPP
ncbi:hypothetical protein MIND_00499200 [Mycena indigotica]|uniref:Pentatricopeptide repeat-containing protein n=1 Tax=Mycena indigotica TaxID=2126181 RepID=A0A8H6SYN8_9AGAR|nr:uncharacterized protein MIND_00499200 [Mycena indigotica]KAF7307061.1 hypothetical protein MIND_00499200 [Mycena indigotica]